MFLLQFVHKNISIVYAIELRVSFWLLFALSRQIIDCPRGTVPFLDEDDVITTDQRPARKNTKKEREQRETKGLILQTTHAHHRASRGRGRGINAIAVRHGGGGVV